MSTCLKRISIFLMLAVALPVTADDITPLVNSARSFHLTPEEKALFVEASDRFKKYEIPKSIVSTGVFWLDNDHLVMSSRKYPGWEAKPEEMSRVIVYNIHTADIVDSGYRGILRCINHLGDVLITQEEEYESRISRRLENYKWLTGKWGGELERTQVSDDTFIPFYLCRSISYGTLRKTNGQAGNEFERVTITPLLGADGAIEELSRTENGRTKAFTQLIKPSGQKTLLIQRRLSHLYFTYLPWSNLYFEARAAPPEPISFSPEGETQVHPIPPLLEIWNKFIYASVAAYPSKKGIIWSKQQGKGYWRKQGIFLQLNSELLRIEEGQALGDLRSSPDGCRIQARVYRGDPFKRIDSKDIRLVIDVCKEYN